MVSLPNLISELNETTIAQKVGIKHDEARMRYPLQSITVSSYEEFSSIIINYYKYHYSACVAYGATIQNEECLFNVKQILENEYKRRGGTIMNAYNDARDGINGGMKGVIDIIANHLKMLSVEAYITSVFERHISPVAWDKKIEIIRQLISHCGAYLSPAVKSKKPEEYAHNYVELIRAYVAGLQEMSPIFRSC